jgi:hypothetical protein
MVALLSLAVLLVVEWRWLRTERKNDCRCGLFFLCFLFFFHSFSVLLFFLFFFFYYSFHYVLFYMFFFLSVALSLLSLSSLSKTFLFFLISPVFHSPKLSLQVFSLLTLLCFSSPFQIVLFLKKILLFFFLFFSLSSDHENQIYL